MPSSLSFLFQAKTGSGHLLGEALALAPAPGKKVDILHYLWLVEIPIQAPLSPPGYTTYLLSTVYDEDFTSYVGDLVRENPTPFNQAAKVILGFEDIADKLPDAAALQKFIALIGQRDLTQTSAIGSASFHAFYPFSAAAIHKHMGGGPAKHAP